MPQRTRGRTENASMSEEQVLTIKDVAAIIKLTRTS